MASHAIATHDLTKRYGNKVLAVDRVSLEVELGEIYGFIGPNGSGKTTTLKMMLGLVRPTSGRVSIFARGSRSSNPLTGVGSMIEAPTFYPHLSGYDNLRMIAYSSGSPEARINEELSRVDLLGSANEPFRTYSLGMKQRLGVAAALLKDPQILILDEPTNGLDPHSVVNIREVILEFRRRGRTVLFSSHQLSDIERLCDRIGVINKGKLVAQGTVSSICGNSGVSIVAEPLGTVRTIVSQFAQGRKVVVQEDRIWVDLDSNHYFTLLQALDDAGVTIRKFEVGTRSLEDVFFELVGPSMPVVPLR